MMMQDTKEKIYAEALDIAKKSLDKFKSYVSSSKWQQNGQVKGQKICQMFKMQVDSRVATMGVVSNVEGTLKQFQTLLNDKKYAPLLDPQMIEFKQVKSILVTPQQSIQINYLRFKGIGFVSDRDLIIVQRSIWQEGKYYVVSSSCNYPYPQLEGVVRAEAIIGGFLGEKVDEKTIKVTHISDGDMKGSFPDFVKKIISQNLGSVASRVNECLKKLRNK